jgi:hypothetical protein
VGSERLSARYNDGPDGRISTSREKNFGEEHFVVLSPFVHAE